MHNSETDVTAALRFEWGIRCAEMENIMVHPKGSKEKREEKSKRREVGSRDARPGLWFRAGLIGSA